MTKFLNNTIQHAPISEVKKISPDSYKIRCALPEDDMMYGLRSVEHVMLFAPNVDGHEDGRWNGEADTSKGQLEIGRPYTPISPYDAKGYVDFVIKSYPENEKYVDGGKFSAHVRTLKAGDTLRMKGPFGRITYEGAGIFKYTGKQLPGDAKTEVNMVCGGSGITPMLQLLYQVLNSKDENDKKVSFKMVYSNRTEADILCRDTLTALEAKFSDRLKVWYAVQGGVGPGWKYSIERVDRAMLKAHLFPPSSHTACYFCGPKGLGGVVREALEFFGHDGGVIMGA